MEGGAMCAGNPHSPGQPSEEQRCERRLCAQGRGPRFVTSGDAGEGPWGPHGTLPRRRADAGEISQSPRKSQLRSQGVGLDWKARAPDSPLDGSLF